MMTPFGPRVGKEHIDGRKPGTCGHSLQKIPRLGSDEPEIGQPGPFPLPLPSGDAIEDEIDSDADGLRMRLGIGGEKVPVTAADFQKPDLIHAVRATFSKDPSE